MGLSSSKTTVEPSAYAKPYISGAAGALQSTFNANQGGTQAIADNLRGFLPDFTKRALTPDAGVTQAQGYNSDVLGGVKYGSGNPHLQRIIDNSRQSVVDSINSIFTRAGMSGSNAHAYDVSKGVADSENQLRYGDYDAERQRMAQAAGQAPGLAAGQYAGVAPTLALTEEALQAPYTGSDAYARGVSGLLGQYTTTNQRKAPFDYLAQAAAAAAQAASASDRRLKTNIERVGQFEDGLGIYHFDYIDPPNAEIAAHMPQGRYCGAMADEVAKLRPWALGPVVGGYATVDYGKIGG